MQIDSNMFGDVNKHLFVIHPALSFFYHKEYKKVFKQLTSLRRSSNDTQKLDTLADRIQQLRLQVDREIEENNKTIKSSIGKPVLYNQPIFLMHYVTKTYMQIKHTSERSSSDLSYLCKFDYYLTRSMLFRLVQFRPVETSDQFVFYDRKFAFQNEKYKVFVSISPSDNFHSIDFENIAHVQKRENQTSSDINYKSKVFTVAVEIKEDYNWIFQQFRPYSDERDPDLLKFFSMVTFQNNDNGLFLSAFNDFDSAPDSITLSKYTGKIKEEILSSNSIWIIEDAFKNHGECIEADFEKELSLNRSKICLLRHFLTGKYLGINLDGKCVLVSSKDEIQPCRVHFYPTKKNATKITNKSSVLIEIDGIFIKPVDLKTDLLVVPTTEEMDSAELDIQLRRLGVISTKQQPIQISPNAQLFDSIYSQSVCQKIDLSELKVEQYSINLRETYSIDDTYVVNIISQDDLQNTYFLESLKQKMQRIVLSVKELKTILESQIPDLINILKNLKWFVKGFHFTGNYFGFEPEKQISSPHQSKNKKMVREFRILDLLVNLILENVNEGEEHNISKRGFCHDESKTRLFYECLTLLVIDYSPNELYFAQWIAFLQQECLSGKLDRRPFVRKELQEFISGILQSNKQIVKTKITKPIIESFMEKVRLAGFEYIKLLKSVLKYKNKAITKNQNILAHLVFDLKENASRLLYDVRENQSEIEIKTEQMNSWVSLSQANEAEVTQFAHILELFTFIFYKNNYFMIEKVKKIFSHSILIKILQLDLDNELLRIASVDLLKIFWIDEDIKRKHNIPQTVYIWSDVVKNTGRLSVFKDTLVFDRNFTEIVDFVDDCFMNINMKNIGYLFSILCLIKKLIKNRIAFSSQFFVKLSLFLSRLLTYFKFAERMIEIENNPILNSEADQVLSLLEIVIKILILMTEFSVEFKMQGIYNRIQQIYQEKMLSEKTGDLTARAQDSDRNFLTAQAAQRQNEETDIQVILIEILKANKKDIYQHLSFIFEPNEDSVYIFDFKALSQVSKELLKLYTSVPRKLRALIHRLMLARIDIIGKLATSIKKAFLIFSKSDKALYHDLLNLQNNNFERLKRLSQGHLDEAEQFKIIEDLLVNVQYLNQILLNQVNKWDGRADEPTISMVKKNSVTREIFKENFFNDYGKGERKYHGFDFSKKENVESIDQSVEFFVYLLANSRTFASQKLITNLDFLSFYLFVFLEKDNGSLPDNPISRKLIFHIVNFFVIVCQRDSTIQKLITELIPTKKLLNLVKPGSFIEENLNFMLALISNNAKLLIEQKDLSLCLIDKYFELLRNDKTPLKQSSMILELLSCFPICNGRAIVTTHQNRLIHLIFENFYECDGKMINLLLKSKLNFLKILKESPENLVPVSYHFMQKEIKMHQESVYLFINFVKLLVNVAESNSSIWTKQIKQFFTLPELLEILQLLSQMPLTSSILLKFHIVVYFEQFFKLLSKFDQFDLQIVMCHLINFLTEEILGVDKQPIPKYLIFFNGFYENTKNIVQNYVLVLSSCVLKFLEMKCPENFDSIKNLYLNANNLKALSSKKHLPEDLRKRIQALFVNEHYVFFKKNKGMLIQSLDTNARNKFNYIEEVNSKTQFSYKLYQLMKPEVQNFRIMDFTHFFKLLQDNPMGIIKFISTVTATFLDLVNIKVDSKSIDATLGVVTAIFEQSLALTYKSSTLKGDVDKGNVQDDFERQLVLTYFIFLIKTASLYLESESIDETLRMVKVVLDKNAPVNILLFHELIKSTAKQDIMRLFHIDFMTIFEYICSRYRPQDEMNNFSTLRTLESNTQDRLKSHEKLVIDHKIKVLGDFIEVLIKLTSIPNEDVAAVFMEKTFTKMHEETTLLQMLKNVIEELVKFQRPNTYQIVVKVFELLENCVNCSIGPFFKSILDLKMTEVCKEIIENFYWKDLSSSDMDDTNRPENQVELFYHCLRFLNQMFFHLNDNEKIQQITSNFKFTHVFSIFKVCLEIYMKKKSYLITEQIEETHLKMLLPKSKVQVVDEQLHKLFEMFFFIKHAQAANSRYAKKLKHLKGIDMDIYCFFDSNSARIPINRNGEVIFVYFILQPIMKFLRLEDKRELLELVDRTTPNSKLITFISQFDYIAFKLRFFSTKGKSKFSLLMSRRIFETLNFLILISGIAVNFMFFLFDEKVVKNNVSYSSLSSSVTYEDFKVKRIILTSMQLLNLIVTLLLCLCWCLRYLKITLIKEWVRNYKKQEQCLKKLPKLSQTEEAMFGYLKKGEYELSSAEHLEFIRYSYGLHNGSEIYLKFVNVFLNLKFLLLSRNFFLYFLAFYFCILGFIMNSALFFSIALSTFLVVGLLDPIHPVPPSLHHTLEKHPQHRIHLSIK